MTPWERKCAAILKKDFERKSKLNVTEVWWTENEEILVTADGRSFIMYIGSDDDEFYFVGARRKVRFPFSREWLALMESPEWMEPK